MTISVVPRVPSIAAISSDTDRINALYGPFRPKRSNPEHYQRKLKFWTDAIEEYGTTCNRLSFNITELRNEFRIDDRSPVCLKEVLDELYKSGNVVTEKDYNEGLKAAESWSGWSQTVAWRGLRKVGSYIPSPLTYFYKPPEEEVRFINIEQVKMHMESIISDSSISNKLMSVPKWTSHVRQITKLSDQMDVEYLLGYFKARKLIIVDRVGSEDVLKMSATGAQKISDVEKGKYDITRTKEILELQLNDITEKAHQAEERARTSLKQGRRNTAKHELRRKKLLEQRSEKLLTMVDNLTVLEMQIEDAESDAVMISAYEAGKKALTGVLADKKMNADSVTEAMLDIQELLDQHADVSAALSQPLDGQDADIDELESELDAILKEDEEKSKIKISPEPAAEREPQKSMSQADEEEALKLLEDLELNDLEDFSKTMSTATGKMDKSGDT